MTDKMIRRFSLEGVTSELNLIQTRQTLRNTLIDQMRNEGYLPIFDLDEVFKTEYREGQLEFQLVIQGAYVGKETVWRGSGIVNGKIIPATRASR